MRRNETRRSPVAADAQGDDCESTRPRATIRGRARLGALLAATALSGCATLRPPPPPPVAPPVADPNMATEVVEEGEDPVSARITLLEENERLRELLAESMSERNHLAEDLDLTRIDVDRLNGHITELNGTIEDLTAKLARERQRTDALRVALESKEQERKQVAEMYAAEKHQRLVFEKELLEREISARSLNGGRDDR